MIQCEWCHEMFVKNTGCLVWCVTCSQTHKICNNCYENSDITDLDQAKEYKQGFITDENVEKFR